MDTMEKNLQDYKTYKKQVQELKEKMLTAENLIQENKKLLTTYKKQVQELEIILDVFERNNLIKKPSGPSYGPGSNS